MKYYRTAQINFFRSKNCTFIQINQNLKSQSVNRTNRCIKRKLTLNKRKQKHPLSGSAIVYSGPLPARAAAESQHLK